jgi:hypothetical protein
VVANNLDLQRNGAVGFIDWLGLFRHFRIPPPPILDGEFVVRIHLQRSAIEVASGFPITGGAEHVALAANWSAQVWSKGFGRTKVF